MSNRMFGWDLPPGVRASDIPGNRPEDEVWERIYEYFWDKARLTKTHKGTLITEVQYEKMGKLYESNDTNYADEIDAYISNAIEYGMEIGQKQDEAIAEENHYYETRAVENLLEKEGVSAEIINKVSKIMGGNYETP